MEWNRNGGDIKEQIRNYMSTKHKAKFTQKAAEDKIEKTEMTPKGNLRVKYTSDVKTIYTTKKSWVGLRTDWDFYFQIDEKGKAHSPRQVCSKHNLFADEVCTNCKEALCINCDKESIFERSPKIAGVVCMSCYADIVNKKTRGLILALIAGAILSYMAFMSGGLLPGMACFMIPYMVRYCLPILNSKKSVSELFFLCAVLFGGSTIVFPLYHCIKEIRLRRLQKKILRFY